MRRPTFVSRYLPHSGLRWLLVVVLCSFAFAADNNAQPSSSQIRLQHQQVLDALNALDSSGKHLYLDDPGIPVLLQRGWTLAGDWAATYLDSHPNPSKRDLQHIFDGFAPKPRGIKSKYGDFLEYPDYSFTGDAISVGNSVYVIEASYFRDTETGTFIVVARKEGHFQALWNIKDLAEKHYAQRDEIGRWVHLVRRAYYNGPLNVNRLIPIAPAANGHPRFAVDAYQSADGGTTLAQLSIWEWDGSDAHPLLIELYQYAADYGSLQFDGETFRIATKEEEQLKSFFSCGMCPEPRGVWTIRITPDGVQKLGHPFLRPEFQWADELLTKVQTGEDTSDLASSTVAEAVKARLEQVQQEMKEFETEDTKSDEKSLYCCGMLDHLRVLRRGPAGAFELALDEAQFRFTYIKRNGKPYFTRVTVK